MNIIFFRYLLSICFLVGEFGESLVSEQGHSVYTTALWRHLCKILDFEISISPLVRLSQAAPFAL